MFITILEINTQTDFNGGKFRPRSEHLLPFLEFSAGHSHTVSRWRRESWRNPAGSRPLGFIINHSTGENNSILTILPQCPRCHASWSELIQLSMSKRSNQHDYIVKLMPHTLTKNDMDLQHIQPGTFLQIEWKPFFTKPEKMWREVIGDVYKIKFPGQAKSLCIGNGDEVDLRRVRRSGAGGMNYGEAKLRRLGRLPSV